MFTSPNATDPFQIAAMRAPRKKFSSDAVRESKSNAAVENHICDSGCAIHASMTEGSKRFSGFSGVLRAGAKRGELPVRCVIFLLLKPEKKVGCGHQVYAGMTQSGKSAESLRTFRHRCSRTKKAPAYAGA